MKGSLTVESAIIIPIIIIFVVCLFSYGIYLHDNATLQGIVNQATEKYSFERNNKLELKSYIREKIDANLFVKSRVYSINHSINGGLLSEEISITLEKNKIHIFDFYAYYIKKADGDRGIRKSSKIKKPTSFIRTINFIDDISDDFSATQKYKEGYKNISNKISESLSGE